MRLGELTPAAFWVLGLYCFLTLLASLAGGSIPVVVRPTHTRLQTAVSFVAGLMLGMALLHLIPHALFRVGSLDRTMAWAMGGFLVMFLMQRFLYFHHHDLPDDDSEHCGRHGRITTSSTPTESCTHSLAEKSARHLSWSGTVVGLSLRSLLDGMALGSAVIAEAHGHALLAGLGTALAVILHKPFDAMAVSTLFGTSGASLRWRHMLNALFALVTPVGAALFLGGAGQSGIESRLYLGSALGFCAGMFLCIASSDLLPELQFHSHDRFKLSLALLAGLGVAIAIGYFEVFGHEHHDHEAACERSSG